MRIVYHPNVYSDLSAIMRYYGEVATAALADEFYSVLSAHGTALADGALITVDETRARVRVLPIRRSSNTVS